MSIRLLATVSILVAAAPAQDKAAKIKVEAVGLHVNKAPYMAEDPEADAVDAVLVAPQEGEQRLLPRAVGESQEDVVQRFVRHSIQSPRRAGIFTGIVARHR